MKICCFFKAQMRTIPTGLTLAAAISLAFLSACNRNSPETLVLSARDYIAKKDYSAAAIQLKSAIQQRENGEARYLLAVSQYELGDYAGSELHLRRALEFGYPPEKIYPELAKVLSGLGEYRKITAELTGIDIADPSARTLIKTIVGEAFLAEGKIADARGAFAAALKATPDDQRARAGVARADAMQGDLPGATAAADAILVAQPALPQALQLKADMLLAQGKREQALEVLAALVRAAPFDGQARFAHVSLLIAGDKLDEAGAAIEAMKKSLPRDVRSRYLEAMLLFRRGDAPKARDAILQVMNLIPEHGPSLLLAGAIEYQLGSLSTAEDHLRKVLGQFPNSLYARNLLIATYLRKGQPTKADEALAPAMKQAPGDPVILRTAGEVAFANNRLVDAAKYYEQALAKQSDSAALKTRLAQIRLAGGETQRALLDLETASGMDANEYQADLALVSMHIKTRQFDKALAAVDALEKKQPSNPLTYSVRGNIYAAMQNYRNARNSLEKALALKFNYLPAAQLLAQLDLADKNSQAARARFDVILSREPNNDGALLMLADVLAASKAFSSEIIAVVDRAVKANPASVPARLALVKAHIQNRDTKAAVLAAQTACDAIPGEPRLLDALGLAQLAAGEPEKAVETFNRLASVMPDSPLPLVRIASAQYAAKQVDAPIQALRKALAMKPDLLDAQREIVAVQLAAGRPDEALRETRAVQKARPREAIGYVLEGDVLASQKKPADAARAYAEAAKRESDPAVVVKQIQMLRASGANSDADAIAANWLKQNPKDAVVRFHVATNAVQIRDYRIAATRFSEILTLQPDNLSVLNNLAWVLSELKDPAALGYAEKAFARAPENADVGDTYGWLLVGTGDTKRGAEILARAANLAPRSFEIRMHLAKALIKLGDKSGARRELETVLATGADSAVKAEAQSMLQTL